MKLFTVSLSLPPSLPFSLLVVKKASRSSWRQLSSMFLQLLGTWFPPSLRLSITLETSCVLTLSCYFWLLSVRWAVVAVARSHFPLVRPYTPPTHTSFLSEHLQLEKHSYEFTKFGWNSLFSAIWNDQLSGKKTTSPRMLEGSGKGSKDRQIQRKRLADKCQHAQDSGACYCHIRAVMLSLLQMGCAVMVFSSLSCQQIPTSITMEYNALQVRHARHLAHGIVPHYQVFSCRIPEASGFRTQVPEICKWRQRQLLTTKQPLLQLVSTIEINVSPEICGLNTYCPPPDKQNMSPSRKKSEMASVTPLNEIKRQLKHYFPWHEIFNIKPIPGPPASSCNRRNWTWICLQENGPLRRSKWWLLEEETLLIHDTQRNTTKRLLSQCNQWAWSLISPKLFHFRAPRQIHHRESCIFQLRSCSRSHLSRPGPGDGAEKEEADKSTEAKSGLIVQSYSVANGLVN